jgi:uncharacterized tellurite resistance protein B-like protein
MNLFVLLSFALPFIWYFFLRGTKKSSQSEEYLSSSKLPFSIPKSKRAEFLMYSFSLFAKVVEADGKVDQYELERLEEFFKRYRLSTREIKVAKRVFREALRSPLSTKDYCEEFRKHFKDGLQRNESILTALILLASADGVLRINEERVLRKTALLLGISEPAYFLLRGSLVDEESIEQ